MPDRSSDESVIAMAREIADDAIRMIRADIELAKKELGSALRRLIVSVVLLTLAAFFLLIAIVEALGAVPVTYGPRLFGSNSWLPWLALGGVFLVLAVLLAVLGAFGIKRAFGNSKGVIDSIKEDVQWARRLTRRSKSAS
jgi:Putative Actinobacterial Holin-X, holin superfamily III